MRGNNKLSLIIAALFLSILFAETTIGQTQRRAPEIKGRVWFNAGSYKNLSIRALRGKVVLIFFWTSNDSNCEGVIEEANAWYSRYKEAGLEIIGVHSFEWELDSSESNLFKKIDGLKIKFPIVIEEAASIRRAYGQMSWPSLSLVDRSGYIRAQYSDSIRYKDVETMLETLLEEGQSELLLQRNLIL